MSSKLESAFKAAICKQLRDCGALTQTIPGVAESSGYPDRFIVHRKWSGYIEFKRANYDLKENQRLTLKEISRRAFPAIVVKASASGYDILIVGGKSGQLHNTGFSFSTGDKLLSILASLLSANTWEFYSEQ